MDRNRLFLSTLVATSFFAPSTSFGQAVGDSLQLVRLEATWNEAHERGDATALDALWDEDLRVAVPGMLPMTKPQVLRFAQSGRMRFERYATSDVEISLYGDAAVVSGRLERRRELSGQVVKDDWHFTKVYVRRSGGWRVVAFHASEVPSS